MTSHLAMPDPRRLVRRSATRVMRLHHTDRHRATVIVFGVASSIAESARGPRGYLHPWLRQLVEAAMDEEIATRPKARASWQATTDGGHAHAG